MIQNYCNTDLVSQNPFSWMSKILVCNHLNQIFSSLEATSTYKHLEVKLYNTLIFNYNQCQLVFLKYHIRFHNYKFIYANHDSCLNKFTLISTGRGSMHFKQNECTQGSILGLVYWSKHTLHVIWSSNSSLNSPREAILNREM